jgi:hypothetical protein
LACGCALWHVARACRSSHDAEPIGPASPRRCSPRHPSRLARPPSVTCRMTLGGVAMLRCFTLAESPASACLPEWRACNTEGPEAHTIYARCRHIVKHRRGARAGRSLWRSLLCFTMAWHGGRQPDITMITLGTCTLVGFRFQVGLGPCVF